MRNIQRPLFNLIANGREPAYQTAGSVGADCYSRIRMTIEPRSIGKVPLGFSLSLRGTNMYALLLPRSSVGMNGIVIPNAPGLIDMDYEDEVSVLLMNLTDYGYIVDTGTRVCQIMFQYAVKPLSVKHLDNERTGGFGSSGK